MWGQVASSMGAVEELRGVAKCAERMNGWGSKLKVLIVLTIVIQFPF